MKTKALSYLLVVVALIALFVNIYTNKNNSVDSVDRLKIDELERQLAQQTARSSQAESDVDALLEASKSLAAASDASAKSNSVRTDNRAQLNDTLANAKRLIAENRQSEALSLYVEAYRLFRSKQRGGLESQVLMTSIKGFAKTFEPAKLALRDIRDAAQAEFEASKGALLKKKDTQSERDLKGLIAEIAHANDRLGSNDRSIELYDALPDGHAGKQVISLIANDAFVAEGRYNEAMVGNPVGSMFNQLESAQKLISQNNNQVSTQIRQQAVRKASENLEILIGAGRQDEADLLTKKLLDFDNSSETNSLIEFHTARAKTKVSR